MEKEGFVLRIEEGVVKVKKVLNVEEEVVQIQERPVRLRSNL